MSEEHNLPPTLLDPDRWGLPTEAVDELPGCLRRFWQHYRPCFHTRTRDQPGRAYDYLSALLRMKEKRNFAEDRTNYGASW